MRVLRGLICPSQVIFQKLFQHHRIVVFNIMRAEDQRDCSFACRFQKRLPELRFPLKLGTIAALELAPFRGIMVEPCSKFRAWSKLLEPAIQRQRGLFDSSRPQTLHQKTPAVVSTGSVVRALKRNHLRAPSLCDPRERTSVSAMLPLRLLGSRTERSLYDIIALSNLGFTPRKFPACWSLLLGERVPRSRSNADSGGYHCSGFPSRKKPPVGPLSGRVAAQTIPAAPSLMDRGAPAPPISVATQPGHTAFTRIRAPRSSPASVRVKALRPAFVT